MAARRLRIFMATALIMATACSKSGVSGAHSGNETDAPMAVAGTGIGGIPPDLAEYSNAVEGDEPDEVIENGEADFSRSPLIAALKAAGFPAGFSGRDFPDCANMDDHYKMCREVPLDACPMAQNGQCQVAVELLDSSLKSVAFKYDYSNLNEGPLLDLLNRLYGTPTYEQKSPAGLPMWSEHRKWKKVGSIKIQMDRFKGTNINGDTYDNVSLWFSDASLPDMKM